MAARRHDALSHPRQSAFTRYAAGLDQLDANLTRLDSSLFAGRNSAEIASDFGVYATLEEERRDLVAFLRTLTDMVRGPLTETRSMRELASASPTDPLADPGLPRGRRILLLGEHLGRVRQLAEAMIRARCRVELVALPHHLTEADLTPQTYAFTLVDSIGLARTAVEMLESLRRSDQTVPLIAIGARDASRHRLAGTPTVPARLDPNGFFADVAGVAQAVLTTWEAVRPLYGPGELRVDRVIQRASVRGRLLTLRPFDYRLLVLLAERGAEGATIEELIECAWSGRQVELRRAASVVRQGLERLRSAFRRAGITIVSGGDARYRLATRMSS